MSNSRPISTAIDMTSFKAAILNITHVIFVLDKYYLNQMDTLLLPFGLNNDNGKINFDENINSSSLCIHLIYKVEKRHTSSRTLMASNKGAYGSTFYSTKFNSPL